MTIYIKNICLACSVRSACPFLRVTGAGQLEGGQHGLYTGKWPRAVSLSWCWGRRMGWDESTTPEDWGPFCHFSSVGRTVFLKEIESTAYGNSRFHFWGTVRWFSKVAAPLCICVPYLNKVIQVHFFKRRKEKPHALTREAFPDLKDKCGYWRRGNYYITENRLS